MQEHEARVRAVYDHEVEEPRAARRRRQVADWGVGEDVFDRMPSRRFSRGAERPHVRRSPEAATDPRGHRVEPPAAREPRFAAEPDAATDELWVDSASAERTAPSARPASPQAAEAESHAKDVPADAVPRGRTDDGRRTIVIGEPRDDDAPVAVEGRRTIVIGGHGASAARRRPPRSGAERVGPRPDRIVAYAVALGVLLILIAILSAGH